MTGRSELSPAPVLAAHLRDRRLELGLTQREVATAAGTSRATVSRLERGAGLPEVATLARIASAMNEEVVLCFESRVGRAVEREFCAIASS